MKKLIVMTYSSLVLGLSLYGLERPSFYSNLFLGNSIGIVSLRLLFALFLTSYAFIPKLRFGTAKFLLGIFGAVLLLSSSAALFFPVAVINPSSFMHLGDIFLLIEGGILAITTTYDMPSYRTRFVANQLANLSYLYARTHARLYPSLATKSKGRLASL